tara:strand:- start:601 stop:996 length:396 start_codon:yes stop_codon:yes gene_type:complete
MNNTYTWRQEQQMLCDSYARRMLVEHGLKEVTTQRQAKNGTRIFLCPGGELLGSYSSGYVRRCDSSDRIWQLNPKYQREDRWVWMYDDTGKTYVRRGMAWARALIYSEMTRLVFIVEYYLRNYKNNTKKNR